VTSGFFLREQVFRNFQNIISRKKFIK